MWYRVSRHPLGPSPLQGTTRSNAPNHSAALCQVFDSIYMDVPMSKVKFNVNGEYAYVQNFKVLQSACQPRVIPISSRVGLG